MRNKIKKVAGTIVAMVMLIIVSIPIVSYAKVDTVYYLGEGQQAKKDSNYKKNKEIGTSDAHYDWNLGKFCISGFSGNPQNHEGQLVILKNVGDEISLSFLLEQDIDALNGAEKVFISEDEKAYDEAFNISKEDETNFGRGALLIKKTDYQNKITYEYYMDYLNGVAQGANTDIILFEEGDYEIALDYQIRENHLNVWKVSTAPTYSHYQIKTSFSVRNSNCMVYPFDVSTGSELVNTSFTENGFYLDMAKSRYLDINIEKQNFIDNDNTFETDTRFNKTATDGEEFTDEGIYIITVHNKYTSGGDTTKKIYVGANPILKAYVTTGNDIAYIKQMVEQGATIEDDGTITLPTAETIEAEETEVTDSELLTPSDEEIEDPVEEIVDEKTTFDSTKFIPSIVTAVIVLLLISFIIARSYKAKKEAEAKKLAEEQVQKDPETLLEEDLVGEAQNDNKEDEE